VSIFGCVFGPFLTTYGTMTSWWMGVRDHFSPPLGPQVNGPFLTSRKSTAGLKGSVETSHKDSAVKRKPKASCVRAWQSPYEIIGDGCDAGGHWYQPLDHFILQELLARRRWRARLWTRSRAGRQSHYLREWCLH